MGNRLTDKQRKKIVADYIELGSYSAVSKKNNVARATARRVVEQNPDIAELATEKKKQDTQDMLSYMDSRKEKAQVAIDLYLDALTNPEKINDATLPQISTAFGIVVDKFTNLEKVSETALNKLDKLIESIDKEAKI